MTVTSVTALGATTIPVTAPTAQSVPVDTNGWVLRVVTSGSDATCDASKFTLTVTDPGYDATGAAVTQTRTIYATGILRKPWNNYTENSTAAGTFDLTLSERIYTGTTITGVQFAAGFTASSTLQTFTAGSVVRNDSLPYVKSKVRLTSYPSALITSANSRYIEVIGTSRYARNGGEFACVEAWYRQGTTDFTLSRSGAMVRSLATPLGCPSGIAAPVYRVPIDASAATDGDGVVRYRVKPWIGDQVWESWVEADAWPTLNTPAELPMVRDYAGKFQGAYAFVNQSGVAGASPAVQTTLTDPGTAGGYATFGTALTALRAFNAARGGGLAHDDISGGILVLRDVTGSTRGADASSYNVGTRVDTASFPLNAINVPIEVRSLSGLPSNLVRMRGNLPDGTAITSVNKGMPRRTIYRGITFDGEGATTGVSNVVISNSSVGGITTTAPTVANACANVFIDCIVSETTAINPSTSTTLYAVGFRYDYRTAHYNTQNANGFGAGVAYFTGLAVSMGSLYWSASVAANPRMQLTTFGGVALLRHSLTVQTSSTGVQPLSKTPVAAGLRIDTENSLNPALAIAPAQQSPLARAGGGFINTLVRCVGGPNSSVGITFTADGVRAMSLNWDFHHVASFGEGSAVGRSNMNYADQGFISVPKEFSLIGLVTNSFNEKTDGFAAPELVSSNQDGPMDTTVAWSIGSIVHDNNATLASRLVYQAIQDVPIGTAITNTAYWYPAGAVWSTAFGRQSLRTGNWAGRNGVDMRGCVWTSSASGNVTHTATDFAPDNIPIDTLFGGAGSADYYRNSALGTSATATDATDFTPKTMAIEGIDSPLLNRIRANAQPVSIDIFGNQRNNLGGGAAGPVEAASVANAPGAAVTMGFTVVGGGANGTVTAGAPGGAKTITFTVVGGAASGGTVIDASASGVALAFTMSAIAGAASTSSATMLPGVTFFINWGVVGGTVTAVSPPPGLFQGRRRYAAIALPVFN